MGPSSQLACALLGAAVAAMVASPVLAGLGASVSGLEVDRAHFAAHMARASGVNFSVTTLTLPNGGVTKEFSRADGTVFAVTWQGPSRPDLRQLLGARFDTFQTDNQGAAHRMSRRRPLVSNHADLAVHSAGRPGGFWGFAYLPQLIPAGFSASDLH
jgi:hypothetical protein